MTIISMTAMLLITLIAVCSANFSKLTPQDKLPDLSAGQQWNLIWHDEFDGDTLDTAKWDIPEYKRRDAQWSRKAINLDGQGNLVMSMFKEGDEYYDGCVRTRKTFEHAFGYYVARMKIQSQPGHWSAFWLYNDGVGKVGDGGRDGTEVDIMEKPWLDERVQQTLHWDGYGADHKSEGFIASVPGVMEGWHTFSLLWTPTEYVFYVDGQETWRTSAGGVCQVPLYLKLSDEAQMQGWAGNLIEAKLPDQFLVDYVRVYDLVDCATQKPVYPVPAESISLAPYTNIITPDNQSVIPEIKADVKPQLINGNWYVGFRSIYQWLGAEIEYDMASGLATALWDSQKLTLRPGDDTVTINGQKIKLAGKAMMQYSRLMVPLSLVEETVGVKVNYLDDIKIPHTIQISTGPKEGVYTLK